jgi:disulfide bond formation protein DsbB
VTRERGLALLALVVSLGALGAAFGSEWFGGVVPCALCLVERWPYRIAAALAVAALIVPPRVAARVLLWLIVLTMAGSVAAAFVHVGVEQGWWPSPLPECAAPSFGGGSIAQRLARMPATPAKPCDDPTFLIPGVPLSMAGMNLALGLAFGGFLAISLVRPVRRLN